ncbi:NUDIX hydrolase [Rhizobium sp. L1K21]|uniref:NUDIX hydrolase n=1 Tax=Rhizobium sp. L1K21 TaxID=2954933 RepID=UPI00211AEC31|nr:NUDIX domain-containing protein [Rhizobium sp. L1K21]
MESRALPAASAILRSKGRYLLVCRKNPPAQNMYAFPGGRVEPGESLAEAAIRECEEETGIRGYNPRLFAVYDLPDAQRPYTLSVFLLDCDEDAVPVAADDASDAGWFTAAEALEIACPESVRQSIARLENSD